MWTVRERLQRLGAAARRSDDVAKDDRETRDDAIEQASIEGLSVRQISHDVGLSPAAVHQIVISRTAARQQRLADAALE